MGECPNPQPEFAMTLHRINQKIGGDGMKQWLQRIFLPDMYFLYIQRKDGESYTLSKLIGVLLLLAFAFTLPWVSRAAFHGSGISCLWIVFLGAFQLNYTSQQLEQMRTLPFSPKDYILGRFLWAILLSISSTIAYALGFWLGRKDFAIAWGLAEPLALSRLLAFGLVHFALAVLSFTLTTLIRIRVTRRGFLWILIPLAVVGLSLTFLDSGASLVWPLFVDHVTLPVSLLILLVALGLTAVCCWAATRLMAHWEIPETSTRRKSGLLWASIALLAVLVCGLIWWARPYNSPVDEDLPPEEQYRIALQCLEDGDIYGAAVSFYACGEYGDARARCWEMWDKIAPRKTVAATSYQIAALTEDGSVLITDAYDPDSAITLEDIPEPHRLISIHGGDNFMVGLYADGTVGLFGHMRSNRGAEIAQWTDIVGLFVSMDYVAGLRADGTPVVCGSIPEETEAALLRQKNLVAIGTGSVHILGVHPNGSITPDTHHSDGRTSFWFYRDIIAADGGNHHSAVLHADGTVTASGFNSCRQCNTQEWTDVVAIDAGWYSTVGLRADGTVVAAGYMGNEEYLQDMSVISTWTDIVAITASQTMLVALRSDGTLVTAGAVERIQHGVSDWENIRIPN